MFDARADVFTTNLVSVADTALFEDSPNDNAGGYSSMPAGVHGPNLGGIVRTRALLRFSLTNLPAGATIQSVQLTVQLVKRPIPSGPGSNFQLHRVFKDWGEGVANYQTGLPATTGEATWNSRFYPSSNWAVPGGGADADYSTTVSSSIAADDTGTYTFPSTAAIVADATLWLAHPETNFGWMLLSDNETTLRTARRFGTRESSTPPVLSVQFSLATTAANPPTISDVAVVENGIRFSFAAETNRTYAIESRSGLDSGAWTTLTNFPASPSPGLIWFTNALTPSNAFFRVRTP